MARDAAGLLIVLTIVGASSASLASLTEDGRYCFRDRRGVIRACTANAVPDAAADERAKQLVSSIDALTVYVIRTGEADFAHEVELVIDGKSVATTVPRALVRVQLPPGQHEVALSYGGKSEVVKVEGGAGDVRALLLRGEILIKGERHWWEAVDTRTAREAANGSRLIVDAQLP